MSNFFTRAFYGVDTEQDQKDLDREDAQLRALNQKRLEQGFYDKKTFDEANANVDRGAIADVEGEVNRAFNDEVDARAKGFRDFFGNVIAFPLKNLPKIIPWQAWAILGVFLFVKFGGLKFLKFKK